MSDQGKDGVLAGGHENAGQVVRIGDTIRRPRRKGHLVVEALLVHLHEVGFLEAPAFIGVDDEGRQILRYVEGTAVDPPPWQQVDATNAETLGEVAAVLARLHKATSTFAPPAGAKPRRHLALTGSTWTHGDVGYSNIVYRDERLVGLIDWEFAAPGHPHNDLAAMLAVSVRGPKLGAIDGARRARAVELALTAIAGGYGLDDTERSALPAQSATVIDDALTHWAIASPDEPFTAWRWRADWFRQYEAS